MDRVVIIGDIHGRGVWKLIIHLEQPTEVIFLGDYFDSFDFNGLEQIHNFKEIIRFKEENPQTKTTLLIGNHDYHYFPEIGYTGTSGYQWDLNISISHTINEYRNYLQMCYKIDKYIFTHAGISEVFLDDVYGKNGWDINNIEEHINDLWKYKPKTFGFINNHFTADGDDIHQSPIWIRPKSLMKSAQNIKKQYIQIVGHTQQNQIDIKGKATGGKYYFIDTLGTSGEYLIIENNQIRTGNVN